MNNSSDRIRWRPLLLCLLAVLPVILAIEHDSLFVEDGDHHFVIKLAKRDDTLAKQIASEHGMRVRGDAFMDTYYHLEHSDAAVSRRKKRSTLQRLNDHPHVEETFQSGVRNRRKRDHISLDLEPRPHREPVRRAPRQTTNLPIPQLPFPDPLYRDQWYLISGAVGGFDMNVREAWLLGYAGRNVSVSILDDGIQRDHPDLAENYDPAASTDINDDDDDPTPQNNGDNKHGTRCAGEVGAIAGNNQCGVGVAFKSLIGGVRMLDGPVSDAVEARSLALNQQHIDIYSASWGPEDDGKTFDGPGPLAREAFYRGIKQGRNGKGNIFVWASGNGGSRQDSCSADGYTTSIYTLSISSATFDNHRPWYLEECPSTIATTYSSANINQPAIVTVDVPSGCTKMHTGTSASAPLAAGIIALALEANPALTWRDMQHLVLRTANPVPLLNNPGWSVNGVGRRISNKFGYGLMDAGKLVKLARVWETVPEQHLCTYEYRLTEPSPRPLTGRFHFNYTLDVNGCNGQTPVLYLEHVQVVATVRYGKRGDLRMTLISPKGTTSVLLPERPQDFNSNGFHKWPFLSVQMWGEDPRGTWTLIVESVSNNRNIGGTFHDWTLLLYGTETPAQSTDPKYDPLKPSKAETSFLSRATDQLTSQSEEPSQTIAVGDLRSAQNCHEECQGCSEPQSATSCFACKHFMQTLRNRGGFRCVSRCSDGFYVDGDKCKACSAHCKSCTKAEVCETCPGAQLLIDVDHYGHFDHGQCVEKCPEGLIADYDSNLIQARCVLKKNPCEDGYYQLSNGNCVDCDHACKTCHGPGALQCDECSSGFSNRTIGYCRPCCAPGEDGADHHCEDCSKEALAKPYHNASDSESMFRSFVITVGFVAIAGCVFGICIVTLRENGCCGGGDSRSNIDYTPLPHYSGDKLSTLVDSEESDLDDEIFDRVKIDSAAGIVSVEK